MTLYYAGISSTVSEDAASLQGYQVGELAGTSLGYFGLVVGHFL